MVFVLVHSPLVGPRTWTFVAQELERRGMQAVVPSLLAAADAPPPQFVEQLGSLAVDGKLPPWSSWWGEDAMSELVPDEVTRAAIVRELPSLPLSYLVEQTVPSPADWERVPSGYLLFSDAYREAAAEARARGWRVNEISGAQHLHTVVAPVAVTDARLRLAAV